MGYNARVSRQLSELCTFRKRLPQGAPTSPGLSNLVVRSLDEELFAWAKNSGLRYSRYADDITISSKDWIEEDCVTEIAEILRPSGFRLNHKKTRFFGPGDRIVVTGFCINQRTQYPRHWRRNVRAIFHQATLRPNDFLDRIDELNGYIGALKACYEKEENRLYVQGRTALRAVATASGKRIAEKKKTAR